jgi:hypothetical protein
MDAEKARELSAQTDDAPDEQLEFLVMCEKRIENQAKAGLTQVRVNCTEYHPNDVRDVENHLRSRGFGVAIENSGVLRVWW